MGTGSFPGLNSGRGVTLTPHSLLLPWSWKSRAIPYSPYGPYGLYRASVPVQGYTLLLLINVWATLNRHYLRLLYIFEIREAPSQQLRMPLRGDTLILRIVLWILQCKVRMQYLSRVADFSWNVMAHGDARVGKWKGNWRIEWVACTLHTTAERGVSSITTADAHTSAASSRLNWRTNRFKWTRPFRQKTKSGFCACAITFQLASSYSRVLTTVPCCDNMTRMSPY